jgi:molecular chaperone DnaK
MFTNAASGQRTMRVSVLQGEREMARDNWRLGEFDVAFEPAPRGRARVGIQFEIDADGILRVLARDTATGRDSTVELQSAVEVSDEAVEKMLGDSLEHAFEDMDERIFTEAKIKAEEMLPAVRLALDQVGHDLPAAEIDLINQKCEAVQSSISSRSASRLRTSTAELDAATQSLATLLLERTIGTSNRP